MNRIRSIDGLRAVSIAMVLLAHGVYKIPAHYTNNSVFTYLSNGSLGVRFFFVISGYLITKLLLAEEKKTGTINIKDFYVRRVLRIFPVFYLYILVVFGLKWFFIPDIVSSYYLVFFAGFYLWNYQHFFSYPSIPNDKGYWFFGHFWSLAVEEQFYLLWPLLFRKFDKTRLLKLCIALMLLMPLLRVAHYVIFPGMHLQIPMMLHTGGDTILTGCLGALLEEKILANKWLIYLMKNKLIVFILFILLFVVSPALAVMYKGSYGMTIGMTVNNLLIIFLVLWCIHIPSFVARVLNSKLLIHIGVLSYSLYVWQQLFLTHQLNYWINQFPQNFIAVFGVATVSYYFVEKPVLRLKNRFKRITLFNREEKISFARRTGPIES
jgi:peptidoglycan/LPS O-acetylase OafA/YrhL